MTTLCLFVCPAALAPPPDRLSRTSRRVRGATPSRASTRDDVVLPESPPIACSAFNPRPFGVSLVAAIAAGSISIGCVTDTAIAGTPKGQGVLSTDEYGRTNVDRCSLEALKKGASTRAAFSDFATQQNQELYVNIEGCDYSNLDLSNEVLSGVKARGANFSNSIFGPESSRADFSDANLSGTKMRSVNLYNTNFAGADLSNADLGGALASGANFGKDPQTGNPANLAGTNFEDTLLSSSDVQRMCSNKTLDFEGKMNLGC